MLLALFKLISGINHLKTGGKWLIEINEQGICWATPDMIGSFNYKLDEIDKTVIEFNRKRSGMIYNEYQTYLLVTKTGHREILYGIGGLRLKKVIAELKALGIKKQVVNNLEYINTPYWFPNTPKISARLLDDTGLNGTLDIEIENISSDPIKLASTIVTGFFNKKSTIINALKSNGRTVRYTAFCSVENSAFN